MSILSTSRIGRKQTAERVKEGRDVSEERCSQPHVLAREWFEVTLTGPRGGHGVALEAQEVLVLMPVNPPSGAVSSGKGVAEDAQERTTFDMRIYTEMGSQLSW